MLRTLMTPSTLTILANPRLMTALRWRDRFDEIDAATFDAHVADCIDLLTDPNDGPVTSFVVIARAIEMARQDRFDAQTGVSDVISNALDAILTRRGLGG